MLKKLLLTILLVLLAASGATAGAEKLYLICDEWPPYQIAESHRIRGFSTEIVEIVFERLNTSIRQLDVFPWKRAITMLEKGKADALFSANYTEARALFAHYPAEPLINTPWVMWVREEDELEFNSLADLAGKRIGMVRGYSYTKELWDHVEKLGNYEVVHSDELNFQKLNTGRVNFIPAELGNGLSTIKKLHLKNIIPLTDNPIKTDGLYIIFNKNNVSKAFVDKFSEELRKLKQEPIYDQLHEKYFSF